jgi:hypothetical protein
VHLSPELNDPGGQAPSEEPAYQENCCTSDQLTVGIYNVNPKKKGGLSSLPNPPYLNEDRFLYGI